MTSTVTGIRADAGTAVGITDATCDNGCVNVMAWGDVIDATEPALAAVPMSHARCSPNRGLFGGEACTAEGTGGATTGAGKTDDGTDAHGLISRHRLHAELAQRWHSPTNTSDGLAGMACTCDEIQLQGQYCSAALNFKTNSTANTQCFFHMAWAKRVREKDRRGRKRGPQAT
jgi:hypothetical protein